MWYFAKNYGCSNKLWKNKTFKKKLMYVGRINLKKKKKKIKSHIGLEQTCDAKLEFHQGISKKSSNLCQWLWQGGTIEYDCQIVKYIIVAFTIHHIKRMWHFHFNFRPNGSWRFCGVVGAMWRSHNRVK